MIVRKVMMNRKRKNGKRQKNTILQKMQVVSNGYRNKPIEKTTRIFRIVFSIILLAKLFLIWLHRLLFLLHLNFQSLKLFGLKIILCLWYAIQQGTP